MAKRNNSTQRPKPPPKKKPIQRPKPPPKKKNIHKAYSLQHRELKQMKEIYNNIYNSIHLTTLLRLISFIIIH